MDMITMLDCLALGFVAGVTLSLLVAWICTILVDREYDGPIDL